MVSVHHILLLRGLNITYQSILMNINGRIRKSSKRKCVGESYRSFSGSSTIIIIIIIIIIICNTQLTNYSMTGS